MGNVGVIRCDAHYDPSKTLFRQLVSHGQQVCGLIEEGHVPGKKDIQLGLRGYYPDRESFEWMRNQGFRYHTKAEVGRRGWPEVMVDIIADALESRGQPTRMGLGRSGWPGGQSTARMGR